MASFNQVNLMGNLTRDPQLSYTPSQMAVVEFGLAVNDKYKDKEEVCFIDCTAFNKSAEAINKYLKKGDPILITGKLKFEQWTTQDGQRRSRHKVTVERFTFLGAPKQTEAEPTTHTPQDDIPF